MKYMIFTLMLCLALVISCDKPDVEEPKDNQEQTDNTGDSQGGEEDEGGGRMTRIIMEVREMVMGQMTKMRTKVETTVIRGTATEVGAKVVMTMSLI